MTFTVFLGIGNHCPCDTIASVMWFYINLGDLRHIVIITERLLQLNTYETGQFSDLLIDNNDFLLVISKEVFDIIQSRFTLTVKLVIQYL